MRSLRSTVFVVDDEPAVLALIDRVLDPQEYHSRMFETAADARAAIDEATAAGEKIDVMILDMFLGDGGFSAEQLLDYAIAGNTVFETIVMSGRLSTNDFYALIVRGASDFLHKPFSPRLLRESIAKYTAIGRKRREFSSSPWTDIRRRERDVFLSYCSADREWAQGIKRLLEREGISVWYADAESLTQGAWSSQLLRQAQNDCKAFLVLVSRNAMASNSVMNEVRHALARERQGNGQLFIPLLMDVDPADIPELFLGRSCCDFSNTGRLVDTFVSLTAELHAFLHPSLYSSF